MNLRLRSLENSRLRLVAVVAVVVMGHVFLLTDSFKPPRIPPRVNDKHTLSFNLLRPTDAPQNLQPSIAPAQKVNTVPGPTPATAPAPAQSSTMPNVANLSRTQRDDSVSLDFQLADIQGSSVTLGKLNLTVRVEAGKYESRALWNAGAVLGETLSSGDADNIFRPRYFAQRGENAVETEMSGVAQDQLSIVWNLRNLVVQVLSQPLPDYEKTWDVPVQLGGTLRQMHWKFEPMDDLILPAGRFRAAKVAGTVEQDEVTKLNIWFAVDFEYVPVRIESREASGRTKDAKISTPLEKGIAAR